MTSAKPSASLLDSVIAMLGEIVARRDDALAPINGETRLASLSLDSIEVVELFVGLEDLVGYELEPPAEDELETVADLLLIRPAQ